MHFAERYKRKIRELEADRERLENRLIEEHAENILLREEFCRLQIRIFLHRTTRSSKEIQEVLGNARPDMVLVTDRYSGYNKLKVKRQFCYVHLLRDIKKEKETFPDDEEVQLFCSQLSELLKMAIGMYGSKESLRSYRKKAEQIRSQIMEICNCSAQHPAVQNLQNIFREKEDCLFHRILTCQLCL